MFSLCSDMTHTSDNSSNNGDNKHLTPLGPEVGRLLLAAKISESFGKLLLTDAKWALEKGYLTFQFDLTSEERTAVLAVGKVNDIDAFAARLIEIYAQTRDKSIVDDIKNNNWSVG